MSQPPPDSATPASATDSVATRAHLRRPTAKLADCVWLPRFIDKARHHLAGTLDPDFVRPFCHPLATDGVFLGHFELSKDEILDVIARSNGDDALVAEWFRQRPPYSAEKVAAWNELAPNIGKPGFPMHRGFSWMLRQLYGGVPPDPRVTSALTAIAFDEGYLGEPPPPSAGTSTGDGRP